MNILRSLRGKILAAFSVVASASFNALAGVDAVALQAEADAFKADAISVAGIIGLVFMAAAFAFVIYKWVRGAIFS